MREALSYSYLCEVSPTAFSVGAVIFLPRSASVPLFDLLSGVFAPVDREGLILSNGYSRQIPGNTHAEANAINNLVAYLKNLPEDTNSAIKKTTGIAVDASSEDTARSILSKAWIYTTLEPCSKRTSGLKDCTAEVIHWGLKRVYMVSHITGTSSATRLTRSHSNPGRAGTARLCTMRGCSTATRSWSRGHKRSGHGGGMSCSRSTWPLMSDDLVTSVLTISPLRCSSVTLYLRLFHARPCHFHELAMYSSLRVQIRWHVAHVLLGSIK